MRPSLDDYFMGIARAVAERATCPRKHVGAVVVREKEILATGYNGSLRGMPHCEDPGIGCLMEENHCRRTVHAEANAILQAARRGTAIGGATMYVTASPCWPCFQLVVNAGLVRVVFGEMYRVEDPGPRRVVEVARGAGVEIVDFAKMDRCLTCGHERYMPPIRRMCLKCDGETFKSYKEVSDVRS